MQNNIANRLDRESCIPDEDIEHAVQQIVAHPYLGGRKGQLKLQHDEKALIGSTTYQDIKQQLKMAVAKELLKRKEQSELLKEHYKRCRAKQYPFQRVEPTKPHDVWAIDFINILLFGIYFRVCVVYDLFSQGYLSIKPATCATYRVAREALMDACQYSGQIPDKCLLSDNGKQFTCDSFENTKDSLEIKSQYIPEGQPWHNGALESGNRDLRKVLYTIAFYSACDNLHLSTAGVSQEQLFEFFQACCQEALNVINEDLVRPKFEVPPMAVLKNQVDENQQKQIRFIEKKQQERKQRMEQLKANGGSKRKRIEDKVAAAWKNVASTMSQEQLFAFSELIHDRYWAITI